MLGVKGTSKSQEEPAIENVPVFTQVIPLPGCPPSPTPFSKFKSSPFSKTQSGI